MDIERIKCSIEGVRYHKDVIIEATRQEFKEFFDKVSIHKSLQDTSIIVEADGFKFKLELSFNDRLNEFTIDKIEEI